MSKLEEREVVACFLEFNGKILILKRSQKVNTYQGKWATIAGYVETIPIEQAYKELQEEIGLTNSDAELVKEGTPLEVVDTAIRTKWIVYPFLFRIRNIQKIRIDWEHVETRWIYPEEIVNYSTVPKLKETLRRVYEIFP